MLLLFLLGLMGSVNQLIAILGHFRAVEHFTELAG